MRSPQGDALTRLGSGVPRERGPALFLLCPDAAGPSPSNSGLAIARGMALTWEEFRKVDVRVGRVLAAEDFPEARNPSYRLTIDFGPLGVKRSSAAVQPWYTKEELTGRSVVAVVNFPPKQIANLMSEVLVLGAVQGDRRVILLRPDEEGERGARIA